MARLLIFLLATLLTYLYPIYFAYTDRILILPKMAGIWFVALCFGTAYVIELPRQKTTVILRTLLALSLLLPFWMFNDHLLARSEDLFYLIHKSEFNTIVETISKNNLYVHEPDAELSIHRMEGYDYMIARGTNYIAIGVNSILDNTDGFLYAPTGQFPSTLFEGHLTYIEKIDNNWYKFSTR